jgi:glycogen operon protein
MSKSGNSSNHITKGNPMIMGVTVLVDGVNFTVSIPSVKTCALNLYNKTTGELVETFILTEEYKIGNLLCVKIMFNQNGYLTSKNIPLKNFAYMYQMNGQEFIDPYAKIIYGRETYGKVLNTEEKSKIRGGFYLPEYTWQNEKKDKLKSYETILYKLHLRGFTKHESSNVLEKGTFLGLLRKIPYLKELGINCIQLMPIYEYNEIMEHKGISGTKKINYWGYSNDNCYFSPKTSYAYNANDAVLELKQLVDELHKNEIELIMEMNFVDGINPGLVQDCLRFWVMEYHIDGFKVSNNTVPTHLLATDPILSNTKLLTESWNTDQIYKREFTPDFKNLYEYNNGYSIDVKRYLRGDEEQVGAVAGRIRRNPNKVGVINYITNHDGFTLMDLYSYDTKHNEANGEQNQDGEEYNYSWNCGVEGSTKIKKVLALRKKQIRNAFTLLVLSQGTPMILAGDEFCFSQKGNNNAYCRDGELTWLDWSLLEQNKDIFDYLKELIQIRKEHPILHKEEELRCMDYISCGYPDLSYHGTRAWYPDYSHYSRLLGVMLSGFYAKINRKVNDQSFYIAINMHWEKHQYDLPFLPNGMKWYPLCNTYEHKDSKLNKKINNDNKENKGLIQSSININQPVENQRQCDVEARSIVVLIGKA